MLPVPAGEYNQEQMILWLMHNKVMPAFFLIIPVMASSVMAASSFAAMMLVLEIEMLFLTGSGMMPDISWFIIMLFIAPVIPLVAIAVTVRGSAKTQTTEEAQQRAVFLIFPILALVIGQFTGVILVNSGLLLGLGIILAISETSDDDVEKKNAGFGNGPASFNFKAKKQGYSVTSFDPVYCFSKSDD